MSFKDKLIKKPTAARQPLSTDGDEPRVYFPDSIGVYCIDNPNLDKRQYKPRVIAVPPYHKTGSVEFKEAVFAAQPYWMGRLLTSPLLINIGYYPPNALYPGTDKRITSSKFDTRIPMVSDETGIDIPLTYDTLEPVSSERARLLEVIPKVSKDKKGYLETKLASLNELPDDELIRISHVVKTVPKMFIPILTAIEIEEEDADGELVPKYYPKIVIFEETLGITRSKALHSNGIISGQSETSEMLDYLYSDIDSQEAIDEKVIVFQNPYTGGGKNAFPAYAVKKHEGKVGKALAPYYEAELDEGSIKKFKDSFLRIVVLEMIQLFSKKGDVTSLEGQIKEYFWSQIRNIKGEE